MSSTVQFSTVQLSTHLVAHCVPQRAALLGRHSLRHPHSGQPSPAHSAQHTTHSTSQHIITHYITYYIMSHLIASHKLSDSPRRSIPANCTHVLTAACRLATPPRPGPATRSGPAGTGALVWSCHTCTAQHSTAVTHHRSTVHH